MNNYEYEIEDNTTTYRRNTGTKCRRGKHWMKGGKIMLKKKMPLPVTINDCLLLWQMGYRVEINDGKVEKVIKEGGRKNGRI